MKVVVEIDLWDEPLRSRFCIRCGSKDFRALIFTEDVGTSTEWSTGAFRHGSDQSSASIPLAICVKCHRLVTLV